jgi:hypothetical protein
LAKASSKYGCTPARSALSTYKMSVLPVIAFAGRHVTSRGAARTSLSDATIPASRLQ